MTVAWVTASKENPVGSSEIRAEYEQGVYSAGAHYPDHPETRRKLQTTYTGEIRPGVRAPVAQKGQDTRLMLFRLRGPGATGWRVLLAGHRSSAGDLDANGRSSPGGSVAPTLLSLERSLVSGGRLRTPSRVQCTIDPFLYFSCAEFGIVTVECIEDSSDQPGLWQVVASGRSSVLAVDEAGVLKDRQVLGNSRLAYVE